MNEFQKKAFLELLDEDGLLISAPGLGISSFILLSLSRLYWEHANSINSTTTTTTTTSSSPTSSTPTAVMVINASKEEHYRVVSALGSTSSSRIIKITSHIPISQRTMLYRSGGVFFISSRILIVDLLSGRAPAHIIAGIVVLRSEYISEDSVEAFILRVFRESNKTGFIKAISEEPVSIILGKEYKSSSSNNGISKLMRLLFVKKLYLWPRFRSNVKETLEEHPPDVVELAIPLSPKMKMAQDSILAIMRGCLIEISSSYSLGEEDALKGDDILFSSAAKFIRNTLDPIWSKVGSQTKQLISDLSNLKKLLSSLMQLDCVSFLQFLESLEENKFGSIENGAKSIWMFSKDGDSLFKAARTRVFLRSKDNKASSSTTKPEKPIVTIVSPQIKSPPLLNSTSTTTNTIPPSENETKTASATNSVELTPVLEENPKWTLLYQVLLEIEQEQMNNSKTGPPGTILIIVKEERTCSQLYKYLSFGGNSSLKSHFQQYLERKAARAEFEQQQRNSNSRRGKRRSTSTSPSTRGSNKRGSKKRANSINDSSNAQAIIAAASTIGIQANNGDSKNEDENEETTKQDANKKKQQENEEQEMNDELFTQEELDGEFGLINPPFIAIRSLEGNPEIGKYILEELQPKFIVIYDPCLRLVRQIEVFKAENPGMPIRVYFLTYQGSIEERKYIASVQREKDAFEQLIKEKSTMIVIENQDGKDPKPTEAPNVITPENMRQGGAGSSISVLPQQSRLVLVDLREFRSSLPSMLHRRGLNVRPTHLEVGDYILSPEIGVERKSLTDLVSSFSSGRLFTQAESLCKHFSIPILLIEWYSGQPFYLPNFSNSSNSRSDSNSITATAATAIKDEISERDIQSKLVILTLHFPKLRILWSRSPVCSAELFDNLKQGKQDPNIDDIVLTSTIEEEEALEDGSGDSSAIIEFLVKIPGIGDRTAHRIVENLAKQEEHEISLAKLSRMSKEELAQLLQIDKQTASKLSSFFEFSSTN